MVSFVHSLRNHRTDLKYCKIISQTETTETTHLFFPATSWKWHSSKLQNCFLYLSSLRRSRDVRTNIYVFNILNCFSIYLSYLFIYLIYLSYTFIYLFIFIHLFIIFRLPPSAVRIRRPFLILQTSTPASLHFNQAGHWRFVPLGGSGSGSLITDHSDHSARKERDFGSFDQLPWQQARNTSGRQQIKKGWA